MQANSTIKAKVRYLYRNALLSGLLLLGWVQLSSVFLIRLAIILYFVSISQAASCQDEHSTSDLQIKAGIVIESVQKGSAAEKAGLHENDILLHWSQSDANGDIKSPYNLFFLETERAPREEVTLIGLRQNEKSSWRLGSETIWGIEARPNFSDTLLAVYRTGQQLVKDGKVAEAAGYWRSEGGSLATSSSALSWLSSWFSFHAAEMLAASQKWQEADAAYAEAIQRASSSDPDVITQLFQTWGITYRRREQWDSAEKCYLQALNNQRKTEGEDTLITARILNNIGNVAWELNDLPKTKQYFTETLNIRRKLAPQSLQLAWTLEGLGNAASVSGDLGRASEYYLESLTIKEKIVPGSIELARTLHNFGNLNLDLAHLALAQQCFYRALNLVNGKIHPQSSFIAVLNNGLGLAAYYRGDLAKAEEFFITAISIDKVSSPNSIEIAGHINNLGMVAEERGDFNKAEQYYQEALAIQQKLRPNQLSSAESFANLGVVYQKLRDFFHAEEYALKASEIANKLAPNSPDAANDFDLLGDIARDSGDLFKAEAYYRRALAIQERIQPESQVYATTLAELAAIARLGGDLDVAEGLYRTVSEVLASQTGQIGGVENVRANFRGKFEKYYKEYIDLLMTQGRPELAFHVIEQSRARTLLETLAANHIDVHKGADPALLAQEHALRDLLQGKMNRRIKLLSNQHTEKQKEDFDNEIAQLVRQHEEIEEHIRAASPDYGALTQPQSLDTKSIQRLLSDDTLLLEYSLGQSRSYVFAVSAHSLHAYELPSRTEIENRAEHLYQLMTEPSRVVPAGSHREKRARLIRSDADLRKTAAELSRMVLGPVKDELQQRRLLIVSDGALQYIPFAALPEPELQTRKTPVPLILRHEILNLPSASVLALLHKKQETQKEVAVFADPVFDSRDSRVKLAPISQSVLNQTSNMGSSVGGTLMEPVSGINDNLTRSVADINPAQAGEIHLPRLAFTRDEARAIMAVVPTAMGMEALGFDASRNRVISGELAQYRVIHFATHALVDNVHPELSGLVLSLVDEKGEPIVGFLGLQDIYNLDLSADLVVLSACQTALGKQINGEGMIGLTRGFMYAGAPHVLASVWKVDDFATAKLMAYFYKALERDRMTPAQALRQAQVELLKERQWSAPYYWAGFTLQGDWR